MAEDAMREIRSMVMLSNPSPPLPLMANLETFDQEADDRVVTDTVCNSHDMIAHLMNKAIHVQVGSREFHERRVTKQRAAEKSLFESIDAMMDDGTMDVNKAYEAFQVYARSYIASFLAQDADPDMRFVPLSQVCLSDPIVRSTRSFVHAQDTLYGRHPVLAMSGSVNEKNVDYMSYPELVYTCAMRIASARDVEN